MTIWVLIWVYLSPAEQRFVDVKTFPTPDELSCRRQAADHTGLASIKLCQRLDVPKAWTGSAAP
jgi:hypothetical protein